MKEDYIFQKCRYRAFLRTYLNMFPRELKANTWALIDLVTNVCIQNTAADAFFRGHQVTVLEDCVEAVAKKI